MDELLPRVSFGERTAPFGKRGSDTNWYLLEMMGLILFYREWFLQVGLLLELPMENLPLV